MPPLPPGREAELTAIAAARAPAVCVWGLPGAGTSTVAAAACDQGQHEAELIERADLLPASELEARLADLTRAGRRAILTSRRRLGATALAHVRVGPLSRADAVDLLAERLAAVGSLPAHRELCPQRLAALAATVGNLPGWLVLAAERATLLAPEEVLASLETLVLELDPPLDDLPAPARALLATLASCPAGLTLPALSAALAAPTAEVLASLAKLGDRALVEVIAGPPTHYEVIAPVRRAVQASAAVGRPRDRAAAAALAIIERLDATTVTLRERSNLVSLLHVRDALPPAARRKLVDASRGLRESADLRTVLRVLGAELDAPGSYGDLGERARLLLARADARIMAGDHPGMLGDLSEAQKLAFVVDDVGLELEARVVLSRARHWEARFDAGLAALAGHAPGDVRSAEEVRLCIAILTLGLGDVAAALRLVEGGLAEARGREGTANAGLLAGLAGMIHRDLDDVTRARARLREGLEAARVGGNGYVEATVRNWLGLAHLDDGDTGAAITELEQARDALAALGDEHMLRAALGHLGIAAHLEGRLLDAEPLLVRAIRMAEKARDVYRGCHFLAHLAIVRARGARRAEARLDLAAIEDWLARTEQPNPNLPALLRIARASVEGTARSEEPRAACSSDVRIALRVLGGDARRPRVRIAADGRWFALDGEPPVSLVRRRQLARFLGGLAARATGGKTTGFTSDELFRIGWPRESAMPEAGRHRVYVAVSELRKMGLVQLVSDSAGYRLDADVILVDEPATD